MDKYNILTTSNSQDYELLDSGMGEKLERFGKYVLSRPDPQVLWSKRLDEKEWKKANGYFGRSSEKANWSLKDSTPAKWEISFGSLKLFIKPTSFKHVGIFPEQENNWYWLEEKIGKNAKETEGVEILNLFGYTGGASLICAKAGAKVVHVDGSKTAINWARENAQLSGFGDKPIRWIVDDARVFVHREIKRGRKYSGIIMDPPSFGHGPKGELWKIEEDLLPLIKDCISLLNDKPLFFLINGYSAGYSAIAYENVLLTLVDKFGGNIEKGELAIQETMQKDLPSRLLPCGIFARWSI